MYVRTILAAVVAGLTLCGQARAQQTRAQCDTQLVLAVDVSGSISDDRYGLQIHGIGQALASAGVVMAATSGPQQCTEIAVVEWSDTPTLVVPWTKIDSGATAAALSNVVNGLDRISRGSTALFDAVKYSATLFTCDACRRVIDVSGDGQNNVPSGASGIVGELADEGITVNGLAIVSYEPDVGKWYREHVQTANGFVIVVDGFPAIAEGMSRKLQAEVAGRQPAPEFQIAWAPPN